MHWKALLTLFVVIALVGLLVGTESGRKYADFLRIRAGSLITGLLTIQLEAGESFQIALSAQKGSFYGQSYQAQNSTFIVSGICQRLRIGDSVLNKAGKVCEVRFDNLKGSFDYTIGGSVVAAGEASSVVVDGFQFSPYSGSLRVEAEVIPTDSLLLTGIAEDIKLSSVTGSIERIKDGMVKSTESLSAERIEINGFIGYLRLDGDTISLSGSANSVRNNFSW